VFFFLLGFRVSISIGVTLPAPSERSRSGRATSAAAVPIAAMMIKTRGSPTLLKMGVRAEMGLRSG
jgi:hypothetical protein